MCWMLSSRTFRAKKHHRCTWCGQVIEAGSIYERNCLIFEGEFITNKFHPECDEASRDEARAEGGCFEFMPGENERPATP